MTKYKKISLFLACILMVCCQTSDKPISVEDKLYQCILNEYTDKGVDIETMIDSLEVYCIAQGVLRDESGKAKFDYYKRIAEGNEIPSMWRTELTDSIGKMQLSIADVEACLYDNSGLDSLKIKKSKYYKLRSELEKIKEVKVQNVAKVYINTLAPADFDHPYFRVTMLITYVRIFDQPSAYNRK